MTTATTLDGNRIPIHDVQRLEYQDGDNARKVHYFGMPTWANGRRWFIVTGTCTAEISFGEALGVVAVQKAHASPTFQKRLKRLTKQAETGKRSEEPHSSLTA